MEKVKFLFLSFLIVSTFASCEEFENTAEPSKPTFLPRLAMNGEANITLDCSTTSYTDPGLLATEKGVEIPLTTVITGNYFGSSTISGPDIYTISYSAVNVDGIPGAAERTILWEECPGDFVTSIAGMYTATVVRTSAAGAVLTGAQYTNMGPIIIRDLGGGKYGLSDALTGWYTIGRGLGFSYAAPGFVVTANDIPGNSFTHDGSVEVGGFGGNATITSFSIDPATKTIVIKISWDAGFTFVSTLTQVQ